jgi:hypothetical protein
MERGVYFDAWYPRQHNYHPSLPPRRLRMIEDLVAYRASMLCWSSLGGGVVSLPFLEEEAFAAVPDRYRIYGHLNDSEFIRECGKRDIKVFGIVFEHAWEYPVELNDEEDRVLAWNELRGEGKRDWMGMREFWQNRYPKLWAPRERYFPDEVLDAWGEPVTDILEECAQRDIHGEPCRALWVECPDREHYNYMMDRNNPVWREYLKAVVRIQIDAGVHGIQFDETEVPMTSLQYGGCFCRTCVTGFREYLSELPVEDRPAELRGVDFESFHYGRWLLDRGFDFKSRREDTPLFWSYMRFQRGNIVRYFAELADYAKEYARSRGREVLVSGNFFHLFDHYYPMEPKVDLIVTEMRNTTFRQPAWFRYAAGFAGGKPLIVVENPYGGVVPELADKLKRGEGYDLFRMSIYEGAALGVNMSLPYGSWMGSVIEDAFYAPHDLCLEINGFLADHEHLFGTETHSEVAVVFSVESTFQQVARRDLMADNRENVPGEEVIPFWHACDVLASAAQPYDVTFFPDGELRPDTLTVGDLGRYRVVILPACHHVTADQARVLADYLAAGGRLLVLGTFGSNLAEDVRRRILEHPGSTPSADPLLRLDQLPEGPQVRIVGDCDLALTVQRVERGAALHLIRYDYDETTDRVPPLAELTLELRIGERFSRATAFSPTGTLSASLEGEGPYRLTLRDVPIYGIVLLES